METPSKERATGADRLSVQLLGPLTVCRDDAPVELPRSRKVRALIAYLALEPREVTRSHLCELLWDSPSDPRGELRWCLSRVRSVLDESRRGRIEARGDAVALSLDDCRVDVVDIARALEKGVGKLELEELRNVLALFGGELLEGLTLDDSPLFTQWLGAERRRLRTQHAAVLREMIRRLPAESDDALAYLEQWLKVDPFERSAHEFLLAALVRRDRLREAEEHLAATIRLFELEGLEWISIREAWRSARNRERAVEVKAAPDPKSRNLTPAQPPPARRASICIMPFLERTAEGAVRSSLGDGLADDIITRLAKLRAMFVIARGTSFALGDRNIDAEEAGRLLNVDYVVSGSIRRRGSRIAVKVELADARGPRIVWADELECSQDDALEGVDRIGNGIVASIAEEVEAAETNRAILKAPSSLDAWEAYHRGLWHMHRFSAADNDLAEHFFQASARLDPTFARAYSGLSFAHFQNAFLHRPAERAFHADKAFEAAGQSLMADDRDPAAHWAMGRALWLRGDEADSLSELETSVELSPNFAMSHYTIGFVHSQSGDPQIAIDATDHSRQLSPFDPLLFAMLATRAIGHLRLGEYDEAANWALKAAARPNAHAHIRAIAANCLAAAGRVDEARKLVDKIRASRPRYSLDEFLGAFRFGADGQAIVRRNARAIGLSD